MNKQLAINGGQPFFPSPIKVKWPIISKEDETLIIDSLNSQDHSYGRNCRLFEEEFCQWNRSEYAINTNSGTAALHMCVAAIGCGCGNEIIVPAYSWSSTATAVLHNNCIPVFVDIDPQTCAIDPQKIIAAITANTKAIIVAHLHGTPADMKSILEIAKKYRLYVIEDACQAHGASIDDIKVGNWGDCAAFSFNQRKTICAGDAGMFVTNNQSLYEKALRFWSFGENRKPHLQRDYHAYALGWMYRSNDLTAAFGRGQLRKADIYIEWQRTNSSLLSEYLDCCDAIVTPTCRSDSFCTYSSYVIKINRRYARNGLARLRDSIVDAIEQEGLAGHIAVWQRYILPEMTVFKAQNAYGNGCPWNCHHYNNGGTGQEPFSKGSFQNSIEHCHSSFCFNSILRNKPDKSFIQSLANCIMKVADRVEEL